MQPRPAALIVLAVLGLVWSGLGLVMSLFGIVAHAFNWPPPHPAMAALRTDVPYQVVTVLGMVLTIALNAWLLLGCKALLQLRPWSAKVLRIYAWTDMAVVVLTSILNAIVVMPKTAAAMHAMVAGGPKPLPAGFEQIMVYSMWGGVVLGTLIALAMPVLVLAMIGRKSIRDALAGNFGQGGRFEVMEPGNPAL